MGKPIFAKTWGLIFAAGLCTAALIGCANTDSAEKTVFQIRAAYDAGPLVLATNYESLPRCVDGGTPVCSKASVVAELRKADNAVLVALDNAESFVRNHPDMDASDAITAANLAIATFANIVSIYGLED
jgi:hypothetical protein